ncbi:MAG: hypothetical protein IBX64_12865 [Actinobacteria bacterium]|nr:hypothetical protein [Actinomycetota bacterium]
MKLKHIGFLIFSIILLFLQLGCNQSSSDKYPSENSYAGYDEGFMEGKNECEKEHEIPRIAISMVDWSLEDFAAAGMDVSEEAMQPWIDLAISTFNIEAQMTAEQSPGTTFFSPAGQSYVDSLNETINKLRDQNPEWFQNFLDSKAPRWMQLQRFGYGLNDPETNNLWIQTYNILTNMTNEMASTDSATQQERIYVNSMAQIAELKTKNEKFREQIDELKGEAFKQPTASQLRVFPSAKTYTEPIFPITSR